MNEENFINFIHQTRRIYGLLGNIIDKELIDMKFYDINSSHYVILSIIYHGKKLLFGRVIDYGRSIGMDTYYHLNNLVKTEFVIKTPNEKHKNSYYLELSKKGEMIVNEIHIRTMTRLNKWIDGHYTGEDYAQKRINFAKAFEEYMDNGLMLETALSNAVTY